jgi:Reverse transcriptase (RNA-dependent DNA polymerase).
MEQIEINLGIRQGDLLLVTLFCLVMDTIMRKLDLRDNISTRSNEICAYADDILIIASRKQALSKTFNKLKDGVEKVGLLININKTKDMCTKKKGKGRM